MIFSKGSKLYGIFGMKCPRCQEGKMFQTKLLSFKGLLDMPKNCPVCGLDFEPEPGFYWGSMYISYAFSSIVLLTAGAICMIGFDMDLYPTWGVLVIVAVLGFLINARFSRSVWLAIWVSYDANWRNKK